MLKFKISFNDQAWERTSNVVVATKIRRIPNKMMNSINNIDWPFFTQFH